MHRKAPRAAHVGKGKIIGLGASGAVQFPYWFSARRLGMLNATIDGGGADGTRTMAEPGTRARRALRGARSRKRCRRPLRGRKLRGIEGQQAVLPGRPDEPRR